jgi:hypothetical protein
MIAAEDDQANRRVAQDCKFGGLLYQPRLALRERDGAVALIGDSGDLYFPASHDRRGLLLWGPQQYALTCDARRARARARSIRSSLPSRSNMGTLPLSTRSLFVEAHV